MILSSFVRCAVTLVAVAALVAPSAAAAPDALDTNNFDATVSPKTDFFRYAVGGWLARNTVPPDRAHWGSFDELQQRNELRVRRILESPAQSDAPEGTQRRKIGDFYAACTDLDGIESAGIRGVRPLLAAIARMQSTSELATLVADGDANGLAYAGNTPGFSFGPEQDPRNATHVIAALGQGGLSLPTPEYYTSQTPRSKAIRSAFLRYARRTFALLGDDAARSDAEAKAVTRLETTLAKVSKPPDALRDPFANYHPMTLAQVEALAPRFAWRTYFARTRILPAGTARIDVGQPAFFTGLDAAIADVPLGDWKSYLRWHDVVAGGPALPKTYRDAAFAFAQTLSGATAQPLRSRTCTNATSGSLGFAVGRIYAQRYFPPAARARARREIALIKAALHDDIETVAWMSPTTRAAALAKLAKLSTIKVGYPDRWQSYATLRVERGDFLGDVLAADRFEFAREVAKIGKPLDRSEWGLTPQTVNAYYDPSMNEIVIPAGILEPPFFNAAADDAVNFGGIGAVVGHEMTHGFDDEGSDFDGDGNLHKIVTKADEARFHARVQCIVNQLDGYRTSVGLHLNGRLDAGEATADLGGTTLAYRALQSSLRGAPAPAPVDGFTPDQRFYLSWAQVWREKERPQAERAQVLADPHPVARYRVNGTISNQAAFNAAFGVRAGDGMWRPPDRRCQVW